MKPKVPSTLSAETFMMSDAMAECNWLRCVWNDVIHEPVNRQWRDQVSREPMQVVMRVETELEKVYHEVIAVTDAKCLYDQLSRECPGLARDRRCAIEMCIVKEELEETNGVVRWVDHPSMPADCLTKKGGNYEAAQKLLATGRYCLREEGQHILARANEEALKTRVKGKMRAEEAARLRGDVRARA